jgi:hypothetical protein
MAKAVLLVLMEIHLHCGFHKDLYTLTRGMHLAFKGPLTLNPKIKYATMPMARSESRGRQRERKVL